MTAKIVPFPKSPRAPTAPTPTNADVTAISEAEKAQASTLENPSPRSGQTSQRLAPAAPNFRERSPVIEWLVAQGIPVTLENYVALNWGKEVDELTILDWYEVPDELRPPEMQSWTDE